MLEFIGFCVVAYFVLIIVIGMILTYKEKKEEEQKEREFQYILNSGQIEGEREEAVEKFKRYADAKQGLLSSNPLVQDLKKHYLTINPRELGDAFILALDYKGFNKHFKGKEQRNTAIALYYLEIIAKSMVEETFEEMSIIYFLTHNSAELFKIIFIKYNEFMDYVIEHNPFEFTPWKLTYQGLMACAMAAEENAKVREAAETSDEYDKAPF